MKVYPILIKKGGLLHPVDSGFGGLQDRLFHPQPDLHPCMYSFLLKSHYCYNTCGESEVSISEVYRWDYSILGSLQC